MKKHLSIVLSLALAAVLLPAAFAQQDQSSQSTSTSTSQQDQTSPSSQSPATAPSAQSPTQPSTSAPDTSSSSSMSTSAGASSFAGTVVKSGHKYVLKTAAGDTYQIDDQTKAKQFDGQQVKVNGSLDKSTSMLHVTDIAPADNR
jgi:cytoskeletal protein RodZ